MKIHLGVYVLLSLLLDHNPSRAANVISFILSFNLLIHIPRLYVCGRRQNIFRELQLRTGRQGIKKSEASVSGLAAELPVVRHERDLERRLVAWNDWFPFKSSWRRLHDYLNCSCRKVVELKMCDWKLIITWAKILPAWQLGSQGGVNLAYFAKH